MKPTITYADFEKLDLRVGLITEAIAPEWSEKLLQFTVDFGPEIGTKTICSGIKAFYQPADFIGKSFVFVVNLAERKMGPSVSQGMMIMADGEAKPITFSLSAEVKPGTIVR